MRSKWGRIARACVAVSMAAAVTLAASEAPGRDSDAGASIAAQTRPNVIVIETDDQTLESMRVMGNVQRLLAAEGTTFDNSFASFPLCCPSRATLLTGQYAHNHTVMGNAPPQGGYEKLDHSNTLAVWLQRAGYHTAHVGKYLNGYGSRQNEHEVPPGWSEWHGATSLPYFGFTVNEGGQLVSVPATPENYQSDFWTRTAVDVVRRRAGSDQPFFMWLAYYAPHGGGPREPDDPPAPARRPRQQRVQGLPTPAVAPRHRNAFSASALPSSSSFNEADVSDKPAGIRNRRLLTQAQIAGVREMYQQRLESLLAVDEGVASLVEALRASGELSNTLIVFTSDNGFFHGEHRIPSGKNLVYEPSVRVPLILRGPGVARGRRVSDLVANIDIAPTIVAAARARAARRLDGRDLRPLTRDRLADLGRDMLLETPAWSAIRTHRFVYVEYGAGDRELYDLASDPDQLTSRHADASLAPIRTELARRLAALRGCSGIACRQGPALRLTLSPAGRGCARAPSRATVSGADQRWLTSATFYVRGRRVAADARAPFRAALGAGARGRGRVTVRAQVATADGRRTTLTRTVRVCAA